MLPGVIGWIANLIGLVYVIVTTVLFVFPPDLPVNGNNMNYCIAAFAIVLIISTIQWFVDGRKNYTGPRMQLEHVLVAPGALEHPGPPVYFKEPADTGEADIGYARMESEREKIKQ